MAASGCLGCHKIGENGNTLGPNLTEIGDRLRQATRSRGRWSTPPRRCRPTRRSRSSSPQEFNQLVSYVASLKAEPARQGHGCRAKRRPGTLPETQVRAMFDRIARVYDRMNSVMTVGHAPPLARAGGGPGRGRARVARARRGHRHRRPGDRALRAARGGDVVGIDFSEPMLELAREKAPDVHFETGNALELPYADAEFDAVTVGFGARNFADLDTRPGRDGAGDAAGRPGGGARDHHAASGRRCPGSSGSGSTAWCRGSAAWPATPTPTATCPSSVRRFPGPAGAGPPHGRRRPRPTFAGCSRPAASSPSTSGTAAREPPHRLSSARCSPPAGPG